MSQHLKSLEVAIEALHDLLDRNGSLNSDSSDTEIALLTVRRELCQATCDLSGVARHNEKIRDLDGTNSLTLRAFMGFMMDDKNFQLGRYADDVAFTVHGNFFPDNTDVTEAAARLSELGIGLDTPITINSGDIYCRGQLEADLEQTMLRWMKAHQVPTLLDEFSIRPARTYDGPFKWTKLDGSTSEISFHSEDAAYLDAITSALSLGNVPDFAEKFLVFVARNEAEIVKLATKISMTPPEKDILYGFIDAMKDAFGSAAANAADDADQEEEISDAEAWVAENLSGGGYYMDAAMAIWLHEQDYEKVLFGEPAKITQERPRA